jgi:bifunctional non-homologous end joining protein LigD
MPLPRPIVLTHKTKPFDDPAWIFELKYDGWRALAVIEGGKTRFLSRKGSQLNSFGRLANELSRILQVDDAILDGEIAVPDETGRTVFADVMHHRQKARLYAFDLLQLNGQDLRSLPLLTRKQRLKRLIPAGSHSITYVDHVRRHGKTLYRLACEHDLEGIVAKRADQPYDPNNQRDGWLKIKNPAYSQREGRGEWFDKAKVRLADPTGRRHVAVNATVKPKPRGR